MNFKIFNRRIVFSSNARHLFNPPEWPGIWPMKPTHGPQTWPWWRVVSFKFINMTKANPGMNAWARRVWVYTRYGAIYIDFYINKKPK